MNETPRNTRPLEGAAPRLKALPGATDCHIHFYLPDFSTQPGGPPIAELRTPEDYAIVQERLGVDRAVIALYSDTPLSKFRVLDERGVRGARIMGLPGGAVSLTDVAPIAADLIDERDDRSQTACGGYRRLIGRYLRAQR